MHFSLLEYVRKKRRRPARIGADTHKTTASGNSLAPDCFVCSAFAVVNQTRACIFILFIMCFCWQLLAAISKIWRKIKRENRRKSDTKREWKQRSHVLASFIASLLLTSKTKQTPVSVTHIKTRKPLYSWGLSSTLCGKCMNIKVSRAHLLSPPSSGMFE